MYPRGNYGLDTPIYFFYGGQKNVFNTHIFFFMAVKKMCLTPIYFFYGGQKNVFNTA
jgi:hypothetical protein